MGRGGAADFRLAGGGGGALRIRGTGRISSGFGGEGLCGAVALPLLVRSVVELERCVNLGCVVIIFGLFISADLCFLMLFVLASSSASLETES